MPRVVVLAGTLVIIVVLIGLTIAAAADGGINVLGVIVSLLVLALLGVGVLGALGSRPYCRRALISFMTEPSRRRRGQEARKLSACGLARRNDA